jgi:FKBP-type peptidyl-prolyl cis-trans isomerase
MPRPMRLAIVLLAASFVACASAGPPVPPPRPIESIPFASSLDVDLSKMTKTASGLYYRDIEVGTGTLVKGKMEVKVHYTGWLTNGVKFDSNAEDAPPVTISLGRGRVVKGLDEGIEGMHAGGRRQLVMPSALGYGADGSGQIPGDAVLVFEVHVISAGY